jgi:hypothetical protein
MNAEQYLEICQGRSLKPFEVSGLFGRYLYLKFSMCGTSEALSPEIKQPKLEADH